MSYTGDLVDIGLNVDISGLRDKLDEIEQALDTKITANSGIMSGADIDARFDQIEDKLSAVEPVDEERVQAMIDEHAIVDEDKIREIADEVVRDLAHSSEGEGWVQGIIDGNDYVTAEDVAQQIRDSDFVDENRVESMIDDALDSSNYVTDSEVRDIIDEHLDGNSTIPDISEVEKLENQVKDLERRFEMYASRVDTLLQANTTVNERMDQMFTYLETQKERNQTALDFFGLIQQAFNLLRRGQ